MSYKSMYKTSICAVDLFCGAGGLTKGLCQSGIDVRLGVDMDPACEFPYTANNKAIFLKRPVEELTLEEIKSAFPKKSVRLIAGCAPCQTFSTYYQKATEYDGRWWLLQHFSRLIKEVLPEVVTMENVPGLIEQVVFKSFVEDLETSGFFVQHYIVNCADFGIPQHRHRLVLIASRLGPIRLLTPKDLRARTVSVRDVISNLPPINSGETHIGDPLHQSSSLSSLNLKRIRASKPGGSWRDWRKDIVSPCHNKKTGKSYASVYGRMRWDEPAPTITTQFFGFGNGRFGHPDQDRAISLREGAIFQGFPKGYAFTPKGEPIYKKITGRLIGNAVPVKLGRAIGKSIITHVLKYYPKRLNTKKQV